MHRVAIPRVSALLQTGKRSLVIETRRSYLYSRKTSTMATPYKVKVTPENTGLFKAAQTLMPESADKVSELLQEDLDKHHVFFNERGFHDHIVHHLLSLYGTGAEPEHLQKAYDVNASYQLPAKQPHGDLPERLANWDEAKQYLGQGKYYPDLFRFFQHELDTLGWQEGVKKYLFEGSERSDDLLRRMYAGLLHPMIQLMFGIEWEQPAIIAAALAQAAVHKDSVGNFLKLSEAAAETSPEMPPILDLFEEVRNNEKLRSYVTTVDGPNTTNLVTEGIEDAVEMAKKVRVRESELEERTAEMVHASVYVASAAAAAGGGQGGDKEPRYDFYLIHHVNLSPFYLSVTEKDWIPTAMKTRMLEYKIRMNLITYLSVGCPPLDFSPVMGYKPRDKPPVPKPTDLLPRFYPVEDDGHTIKLARAVLIARDTVEKYSLADWVRIRGHDAWVRVMYTVLDATVDPAGERWVRGTGNEEAWAEVPKKEYGDD